MNREQDALDIQVKAGQDLSETEYAEIVALTSRAFKRDYTLFLEMFPHPTHVLGRYQGKIVTYVLWITRWLQIRNGPLLKTAYIEGMATDLQYRHRGFASQLMQRAIESVQDFDIAALATGSHGFYERLGWRTWEGPLYARKEKELIVMPEEKGCVMVYALSKTPPLDIAAPLSVEWRAVEPW
jgi:aminoglycoside 2'-N-acetyltransferase I